MAQAKKFSGKVWKYGDDVNTDVIFAGKYTYTIKEPAEMAKVACEDLDPEFNKNAQAGDIIVGGKNWGCGSSREQAVTCLKERGIAAIIAKSFARIYYRNCFNSGLGVLVELRVQVLAGDLRHLCWFLDRVGVLAGEDDVGVDVVAVFPDFTAESLGLCHY